MTGTIQNLHTHVGTLATNGTAAADATRKASPQAPDSSVPSSTDAARTDQASLSAVGGLVAQASAGSDVRLDKVAALQQTIADGTYHVPASAVAGKIVDSLLS